MEPRGWWKLEGAAGDWTILFTGPAHFVRPVVLEASLAEGQRASALRASPRFDCACFSEATWDRSPARAYWQPFEARSTSVTHVGFKLATDGVDGPGPLSQAVRLSIHRRVDGPPETWPAVGPSRIVPEVDCGGAKSYHFSAGWHSGEVPMVAGKSYAVKVEPVDPRAVVQAFWEPAAGENAAWRTGADGPARQSGHRLWLTVSGDGDGRLIPCNKTIHQEFGSFAGYRKRWAQTWKAQGSSLCGVTLYTATSGTQPRMEEQRIAVRIRRSSPEGPLIGPEKIAAVSANYTGDAAWGVIAAVYARDELRLDPGETYAAEWMTLETSESIGSFVNFKGQPNDRRPGFNPYLRHPLDPFSQGEAWDGDSRVADADLDMQVVEYAPPGPAEPPKRDPPSR